MCSGQLASHKAEDMPMPAWISCTVLCLLFITSSRAVLRKKHDDPPISYSCSSLASCYHSDKSNSYHHHNHENLQYAKERLGSEISTFPNFPECPSPDTSGHGFCPRSRYGLSSNNCSSGNFTDVNYSSSSIKKAILNIPQRILRMPKQGWPHHNFGFPNHPQQNFGQLPPWHHFAGGGGGRRESQNPKLVADTLHAQPKGSQVGCQDPGHIRNGFKSDTVRVAGGLSPRSTIEYSCNKDYYLVGSYRITCLENGSWSDKKPKCVHEEICKELEVPVNGMVNYLPPLMTPSAVKAAAMLPVMEGKAMSQKMMKILDESVGKAEGGDSTEDGSYNNKTILSDGSYKVGTRAIFNCESKFYTLEGSKTRRCLMQGRWSGKQPVCVAICGKAEAPRESHILNGTKVDPGRWPMQAAISVYFESYNEWFIQCGGTLITEEWVMTAGHCVTEPSTNHTLDNKKFIIYLGKQFRNNSEDDDHVQARTVTRVLVHPDYDPTIFDSDIALIFLTTPVTITTRVQPACLPNPKTSVDFLSDGSVGVVPGWGRNGNGNFLWSLEQVELPVVSNHKCSKSYEDENVPLTITDNMFCAGYKDGHADSCSGDSGGPWLFYDTSKKRWNIEGVVSWGSPDGCGLARQYGGFTAVHKFLNWIHLFL